MKNFLEFRAQAFLGDLAFAVFIFILLFAFLYSQWQGNLSVASSEASFDELLSRSSNAVDVLVSSQGLPSSWELLAQGDIASLGLAKKKRTIDERKLARLVSLDYSFVREKLRLSGFDFFFRLHNSAGIDINFGLSPDSNLRVVSFRRIVDYKGVESIVDFSAFEG